jgi:hypothetical protein
MTLSRFEKRLSIFVLVFVAIYLGAAALTIHSKFSEEEPVARLESPELTQAESRLLLVELFLPMLILLTLTVCYIVVRKQRSKKYLKLDESDDDVES